MKILETLDFNIEESGICNLSAQQLLPDLLQVLSTPIPTALLVVSILFV